ncbi:DinB family protein [Gloeothece citriformis PCC 7424]|uniref:DinB family protein n=1 Tax=Gloeothece citriformis (strain PCC 7424) TaxID=65393 RepID=B7KKD1_GLOC7|nr:DinB family protein [Gloeothece citriformis]ACK72264.1 DinB family protein [Gloeothece citriformis PCC 7424]
MITPNYLETMALYNKWQNENLFKMCDELGDEQLHLNRKMFFDSIFKTLNHIINVDETIHFLIHHSTLPKFEPNLILYSRYSELTSARFNFDQKLVKEAQECSQVWLDENLQFWSERLNRNRKVARGFFYVQMFNHQTHHRSQITSELYKIGIDYGSTDLPYNPYYEF